MDVVGADAIAGRRRAPPAWRVDAAHEHGGRWFAVLGRAAVMRRRRRPDERDFTSRLRSPAVTARVGLWLGICFGLAFVTGLVSHWAQTAVAWLPVPDQPGWGYRVTQGLHVIAGTAAVPLLLVKLWTVYPKLFARPPRQRARARRCTLLERVSIAVLVAAAIFQLATGLAERRPVVPLALHLPADPLRRWPGSPSARCVVHIAVKLPVIRAALASDVDGDRPRPADAGTRSPACCPVAVCCARPGWPPGSPCSPPPAAPSRGCAGSRSSASRSGDGPAEHPGQQVGRGRRGRPRPPPAPAYRLTVAYGDRAGQLSLADLRGDAAAHRRRCRSPASRAGAPAATWTGVPVRDLLDLVDAPAGSECGVESLQERGALPGQHAGRQLLRRPAHAARAATSTASRCRSTTATRAG